ncbi:hypothetical protein GWK47_019240 [Chionoecetes opilio]|uniref:Uncharacterized protein n=1 Tax=Chionoecetes opilio TaxID=41210 RepID=A0A8J4XQY5_CHIOP|nr:hypothetical protein GWK47_019240 [Chionoecetes opilio]
MCMRQRRETITKQPVESSILMLFSLAGDSSNTSGGEANRLTRLVAPPDPKVRPELNGDGRVDGVSPAIVLSSSRAPSWSRQLILDPKSRGPVLNTSTTCNGITRYFGLLTDEGGLDGGFKWALGHGLQVLLINHMTNMSEFAWQFRASWCCHLAL